MLNVISLFDGMSVGQLALQNLANELGDKFLVDNYYASEIDKYAMTISHKNFPNTKYLDSIVHWEDWEFPEPIDLVMGGSPCQGFSLIGKQLNFDDPRSKLFFDFVHVLEDVQPKYFLLENVVMKQEYQDLISELLGVPPIKINSALVSAQNRNRLYWTNIPNVEQPEDQGILLKDIRLKILDTNLLHTEAGIACMNTISSSGRLRWDYGQHSDTKNPKSACLTASLCKGVPHNVLKDGDIIRKFDPIEAERLQTLPTNYTAGVSNTQRYKMIGNGWTCKVIEHILKNMEIK